ncbi:uncharacterized protein Triagg1_10387 [Trichoderma aggressivum f. europaeum]|uniref:Uncharacterized protein n=1 Tax=Trichoderma aggressivum f. europaeum TaxID=173218 RepID=A0AAE1J0A8_9HYPO|nr:hypothetical protein Triagg1_10387 [Trichoderma aggressivum f. europaeum]
MGARRPDEEATPRPRELGDATQSAWPIDAEVEEEPQLGGMMEGRVEKTKQRWRRESRAGVKVGGFEERGRWKRDEMTVTASQGESRQGKGEGGMMRGEAKRRTVRFRDASGDVV